KMEVTIFLVAAEGFIATLTAEQNRSAVATGSGHDGPLSEDTGSANRFIVVKNDGLNVFPEGVGLRKNGMSESTNRRRSRRNELALVKGRLVKASREGAELKLGGDLLGLAENGGGIQTTAETDPYGHVAAQTKGDGPDETRAEFGSGVLYREATLGT